MNNNDIPKTYLKQAIENLIAKTNGTIRTQTDICNATGINKATFSNWMNGRHEPNANAIMSIARVLHPRDIASQKLAVYEIVRALTWDADLKQFDEWYARTEHLR